MLTVSSSPHAHCRWNIRSVMLDVLIALLPATIAAIYFFGIRALMVISVSVFSAVIAEGLWQLITGKKVRIDDFSAVVTGLLYAMCLPPLIPLWIASLGAVVSIILAKEIFGGIGQNLFNPAHIGRAVLLAAWPVYMTTWMAPAKFGTKAWWGTDVVTTATPLGILKESGYKWSALIGKVHLKDLFIGNVGGSLGETSALAILIGAIYLVYKEIISLRIPLAYLLTVFVLSIFIDGFSVKVGTTVIYPPVFHLFAGGLMLGAWFMATDMVTSPVGKKAQIVFGILLGVLTISIRHWGGYPEGVCYSILIMNAFVPLLDKFMKEPVFGEVRKSEK